MEKLTLKQVLDKAMKYNQSYINTALPCKVIEFDKDTQLATVQILIDKIDSSGDEVVDIEIPQIAEIPVIQPFSGSICITMPIEPDDTGLLVFNQRNIDTFVVEGTQAVPFDNRMHDIQDCVLIMGLTHQKRVIPEYDDDGMAIRSEDNSTHIQLKQDGTININSGSTTVKIEKDGDVTIETGKIALTGDIEMTGNLAVTGKITATDNIESDLDVKAGAISLLTHTHGYIDSKGAGATPTPSITLVPNP